MPSLAGKWNQHLHKACQQKEAWSALTFPGRWLRWLWTSENTVTDDNTSKSSLTEETSHWTSSNMDSVPLHSSPRLWDLDFQMKFKIYFHLKRGLWTTTVQLFFSLALVRCFWRCFCFRSGLVALFPKMSKRGDSWCTDSSFSSLLVKLSQVFQSVFEQYSQACGHPCSLCTFSYPISSFQSTLHLICFDTALIEQPPHCQVSSVHHYCGFKEQEIPTIYTVWMVIYWNSNVNIPIFWDTGFLLSLAVSSNHQNKN